MKNKLKLLVKDGIRKKLNTKWFKVANIVLLLIIVLLTNIDGIIKLFGGDFNETTKLYVIDNTNVFYDKLKTDLELTFKTIKSIEELKEKIKKEESKDIILEIDKTNLNFQANITSFEYIDGITLELITSELNNINKSVL